MTLRKYLFALLLLVSVLGVTACQDPYQGNPAGPKTALVGDSITALSKAAIYAELAPDFFAAVAATTGERTDQYTAGGTVLVGDASAAANSNPAIAVINLGTNDIAEGFTVQSTLTRLAGLRAKFSGCVVSVTISTHGTSAAAFIADPVGYNARAAELNAGLPTEHLIDWAAETGEHPELLNPDGIHPSPAGQVRYAEMIHTAANGCLTG